MLAGPVGPVGDGTMMEGQRCVFHRVSPALRWEPPTLLASSAAVTMLPCLLNILADAPVAAVLQRYYSGVLQRDKTPMIGGFLLGPM